jgi:hypothetical protein
MNTPSNRKLWIVGTSARLGLFLELFVIVGGFNASSASDLYRNTFRWNVVCAVLAPVALVLGVTLDEKRLRTSVILTLVAITGPLFVFLSMQPARQIYCFIQGYRPSPLATLGGFTLVFAPLVCMAAFLATLLQRSRSIRSLGVAPWQP